MTYYRRGGALGLVCTNLFVWDDSGVGDCPEGWMFKEEAKTIVWTNVPAGVPVGLCDGGSYYMTDPTHDDISREGTCEHEYEFQSAFSENRGYGSFVLEPGQTVRVEVGFRCAPELCMNDRSGEQVECP